MKSLLHFIRRAYARMIRAYPSGFRNDFGDEMEVVFDDLTTEAARQGRFSLLSTCLRELFVLPISILAETWHEMESREAIMAAGFDTDLEARVPSSWGQAFLAGLPHGIIISLIGLASLLPDSSVGNILGWSLIALVIAGFIIALLINWQTHWPAWGASWFGYAGLLILIIAVIPSQGWNPPISTILHTSGSLLLLALTLLTLRYWLTRRDPIQGLLLGFPIVIIYWLPITEFVSYSVRLWLIGALFMICALAATLISRRNSVLWGTWTLLAASAAGGLPLAFARTYLHTTLAGYFEQASLHQVLSLFSGQFLAGAALALGPVLGWGLWSLGKRLGTEGRLSAGLLIAGMVVNLFGLFSYWRWFDHLDYFDALGLPFLYKPGGAFSIFLIYAGLVGIAVGGVCLGTLNWRRSPFLSITIGIAALLIPHFAMFSIYSGYRISMPGFPLDLNALTPIYKSAVFEIAILLLLLIGWTITQLFPESHPPVETK